MADQSMESPDVAIQRWLKGEIKAQELFALDPRTIQALAEHGYLLYEQGRYRQSQTIFEALAAIDNSNPNFHRMLGSLYQIGQQWDAAYYRYTLVLKSFPQDISAWTNRGEVLLKLGRNKEGLADLKQAILLDHANQEPAGRRARYLVTNLRLG
jgi:tetratricopeptide (TPR) repeat protein